MMAARPRLRLFLFALLFFLSACRPDPGAPGPAGVSPVPAAETTAAGEETAAQATAAPQETPPSSPVDGLVTLRVWLPPAFSPDPATPAGALLAARLDEFALLHPGLRITVRLKGETGPGGMVASLDATAGAAPAARPDLVLMPRPELERAAQAGLLSPFPTEADPGWYDFARELAVIDLVPYGLPFAADALALMHRPGVVDDPPTDWTTTLNAPVPLLFAGGSPDALFPFALYAAAGGRLLDEDGSPSLDEGTLTALLGFLQQAQAAGVIAANTVDVQDEAQAFAVFESGETHLAVTWVSHRLGNPEGIFAAAGLPTVTSVPYTLVTGWAWTLSNPDAARQGLAVELAQFLSAPDFLAAWTLAAGMLPPHADALAAWPDSPEAALASRIVLSGHLLPPLAVLEKTGPVLQQAVEAILRGELTPEEAAGLAVSRVNAP